MLTDPAAAPATEKPQPDPGSTCASCGAHLDQGQEWCLHCGAGAPGSLDPVGPGWRSATTVLAATAALVLGAAAAGYAALSKSGPRRAAPKVITVAQAPAAGLGTPGTASTPGSATPGSTTPEAASPGGLGTPTTIKPPGSTKPPKIPLTAPTPKSSETSTSTAGSGSTGTSESTSESTSKSTTKSSGGTTTTEQATPLLLDTNAASTYNPYGYPASEFGDPSLAIDGETATAWTASVNPAVAPKMAEGLVIDLKTAQKVAAVTLISSTPGMTVQVYGANGHTLPGSITDPAWTALSAAQDAKKRSTHIKLRDSKKAFRFVVLWISKAPASAVGTAQAPAHVSVNELELFAPK